MGTRTFQRYQHASGWNALLSPQQAGALPLRNTTFSTIVIGAGYTGLAAAMRLSELNPSENILIIDAGTVGEGASGRNSGFIINVPYGPFLTVNADTAAIQQRLYTRGLQWLADVVADNGIDCQWNPQPKYHGAASRAGVDNLKSALDHYRKWGIRCDELTPADMSRRLGTEYYQYGFVAHNNVFVQPAALIRGLADALPANVQVAENEVVTGIDEGSRCRVTTTKAHYTADKVVIANNSFAKTIGLLADRVVSMVTYAGLTPVLSDRELSKLGQDEEWGLIPASQVGGTLRRVRGGRFLVRSGYNYEREDRQDNVLKLLTAVYKKRFPNMASHDFEHVWGGSIAVTRNGSGYFGEVKQNIYASIGCNGTGILKGVTHGRLLAEYILGQQSEDVTDVLRLAKPGWLPPEPIRRVAVYASIAYQRALTSKER